MYVGVICDRKEEGEPSPFDEPLLKEIAGRIGKSIAQVSVRVKLGKFGHQENSDTHLQTVEIQMSRPTRIFTVCLAYLIFIQIIQK